MRLRTESSQEAADQSRVFASLSEPEGNLCQFSNRVLEGGKIHHIVPVAALAGEGLVGLEPSPTLECGCQEESLWLEPPPPVELS